MFTLDELLLLMGLQYELPFSEQPFTELAEKKNLSRDFVLEKTKELKAKGIVKRVGANLNYKAFKDSKAALVGAAVEESSIAKVTRIINATNPKHNFWRDHEKYSVWFTMKARSEEELKRRVEVLMEKCRVKDYVVLPTKRIYKMDVKYDLIRGISWSKKGIEPEEVPMVDELKIDTTMLRKLEALPISARPFKEFKRYGYTEAEIVDLITELIEKGVVRDFSGVLNEGKIGFKENGMTILKLEGDARKFALKLIEDFPQLTHLIERIVPKGWAYPIYFMVHAVSREPIEEIKQKILEYPEVKDAKILYSRMDLKTLGT